MTGTAVNPPATASAAASGPSVNVTPSTGLQAAGDSVTVSGTGFDSSRGIYLMFCKQPSGAVGTSEGRPGGSDCASTQFWITNSMPADPTSGLLNWTGSGTFTATVPVSAAFKAIDCLDAATTCGIVTRNDHNDISPTLYDQDTFTPVSFTDGVVVPPIDPDPQPDTVTISLSKSSGLADGEVITVNGLGFVPAQGVYVQLCATPTGALGTPEGRATRCYPGQDGTHTIWVSPVPADGTFSTPLTVTALFSPSAGDTVDCRIPDACGVFVRRDHNGSGDYSQDAFAPLLIGDEVVAPPTPGTLTGTPLSGLNPDGDTVAVSGEGFQPGSALYVTLCDVAVPAFGACDLDRVVEVTPDSNGAFNVALAVRGTFGSTNCTPGGAACAIRSWAVSGSSSLAEATLPVTFRSSTATVTSTTTDTTALPLTGSRSMDWAVYGLIALASGAALLVGTSLRRRAVG